MVNQVKKKKILIWSISIVSTLLLMFTIFLIYVSDYYHADEASIEVFKENTSVIKTNIYDDAISYIASDSNIGLIFYPGGKVEYTSYEPLMYELASKGITCVLIEMPFNLAVFNANAADNVMDYFPEIDNWYIAGHSLGGTMAAIYLANNADKFDGLILLGSYSTTNLSNKDLKVLSIYGSEDKVMNKEKYEQNKVNLPSDFTEQIISGGSHAYFGMYGEQAGDGKASISNEEQIYITANYIYSFIKEINN